MDTVNVVYLAGVGRSGTTIIDRSLGTLDGVTSFCEIRYVWERGFQKNAYCSCGERFDDCSYWTSLAGDLIQGGIDVDKIIGLQDSIDRSRYFFKVFTGIYGPRFRQKLAEYRRWLRILYVALAKHSGTHIMVDSSKGPVTPLLLKDIPELNVFVVHVVRDIRAVCYAYTKEKYDPGTRALMPRWRPRESIASWMVQNAACNLLSTKLPYVRVRYEDFARNPRTVLQDLVDRIEPIAGQRLHFQTDNSLALPPLHTMSGNPHRFEAGVTTIRLDEEWRTRLDLRTRRLATLFGYPLLTTYGYLSRQRR